MNTPAELLEQYSQAFARDPEQAARDFYSDDVLLRIPGTHPYAGTYRSRETAAETLTAWTAASNGTLAPIGLKTVAFAPDAAIVHVAMSAAVDGRTAQWERMILYQFHNGRICNISFFEDDLHAVDDLFNRGQGA